MADNDPDAGLVAAAIAGDHGAFESLLRGHYDRIHGLAWQLTGSRADADDVAQDVCCALVEKIGGFRGEAKFTTWLCGITFNACRDLKRKRRSFLGFTGKAIRSGWPGVCSRRPRRLRRDLAQERDRAAEARLSRYRGVGRRPAADSCRGGGGVGGRGSDRRLADERSPANAFRLKPVAAIQNYFQRGPRISPTGASQ